MVTQAPATAYACFQLGRERCRSFSIATHGGTTLRRVDAVDFATLRPPHPRSYASHPPSSAQLHSLRAALVARSKSGVRHCCAEPGVICAVWAIALRLAANLLQNNYRFTLSPIRPPLRGLSGRQNPSGTAAPTSPYPDHHPSKRLGPFLSAGALLGVVPPPNPPHNHPLPPCVSDVPLRERSG